jgi:thioredoxin reductase (NADPH)
MLLQSSSLVSIRAGELCRLASFDRQLLHEIMARYPMVGEAIFKVMTERFVRAQGYAKAAPSTRVVIRGGHLNPLLQPLRSFLFANHIPYECDVVEAGAEPSAESSLSIVIDGVALSAQPSLRLVAETLQLQTAPIKNFYDVVIVGAGPAGMAAPVYASSEGLNTIVIERSTVGGQAGTSSRIENYLGFPGGISGDELGARALKQAQHFGAEILVTRVVLELQKSDGLFRVTLDGADVIRSRTVLLASGVEWRLLDVPGTTRLLGRGVFYGNSKAEAMAMVGKRVFVVGGGNSAGQAAMFLSLYASEVHIVIRKADLSTSMSNHLIEQLSEKANVQVHPHTVVKEIHGEHLVERIDLLREHPSEVKSTESLSADALFVMIGGDANTDWLPEAVERDDRGYVKTGQRVTTWTSERPPYPLESSIPGLFCAGDVRAGSIKRVASGVGEGSMAVSFMHSYLGLE